MSFRYWKKVLITGCGGDIGLSVARILRDTKACEKIIGLDIHDDHAGFYYFDQTALIPPVRSPEYFPQLEAAIKTFQPELIVPGSEAELRLFFNRGLSHINGIPLLIANLVSQDIGFDKLKTVEMLKDLGLPFPWTMDLQQAQSDSGVLLGLSYPCVVKARNGQGSRFFWRVSEASELEKILSKHTDLIAQELLLPDEQEYTCGLFRSRKGEIRTVIFRRKLEGGRTGSGCVVNHRGIELLLEKIAVGLNLHGSINVQLRLTIRGPVVFEINPRFSSTVYFRHLLGFRDVVWSWQDLFGDDIEPFKPPAEGTRFYRCAQEVIRLP